MEHKGFPLLLCQVEGCPRSTLAGQDAMCGLAKIYGLGRAPHTPLCGSVATLNLWEEMGLMDGIFNDNV